MMTVPGAFRPFGGKSADGSRPAPWVGVHYEHDISRGRHDERGAEDGCHMDLVWRRVRNPLGGKSVSGVHGIESQPVKKAEIGNSAAEWS